MNEIEIRKTPKVSVIVPVYRVEKYLGKCIESILHQTYPNWELLLVDDGSPDRSGRICDEYDKKDARIKVIHKENGGVSSARNIGIEQAKGDYVMFVDADDWLDSNCIETCFNKNDNVDLIRFGMQSIYEEGGSPKSIITINENLTIIDYRKLLVSRKTILGVCGGIYKRSIFTQQSIRFDESLLMGEDWLFNYNYVKHCSTLCIIDKPLYIYNRFNESGCTNSFSFYKDKQLLEVAHLILNDKELNKDEYNSSKTACKLNVYYQALSHAICLSSSFKQLNNFRKEINSMDIAPSLMETMKSDSSIKIKIYMLSARVMLLLYMLYLKYKR